MTNENERAPADLGSQGAEAIAGQKWHASIASARPLLQRLDDVRKSGLGWRTRCPNCGGRSRKLTVVEKEDRVLLHCFGCHDSTAILAAIGLIWADLQPPRHWPSTPVERRNAQRAMREAGLISAIEVLAEEAGVIQIAGYQLERWQYLSTEDCERLHQAICRVGSARATLGAGKTWRPRP